MSTKHSKYTRPVEPVVYAVGTEYCKDSPSNIKTTYGTVRRNVTGTAEHMHVVYVIQNRMGIELNVDADSIDALIAVLSAVRAKDQS